MIHNAELDDKTPDAEVLRVLREERNERIRCEKAEHESNALIRQMNESCAEMQKRADDADGHRLNLIFYAIVMCCVCSWFVLKMWFPTCVSNAPEPSCASAPYLPNIVGWSTFLTVIGSLAKLLWMCNFHM